LRSMTCETLMDELGFVWVTWEERDAVRRAEGRGGGEGRSRADEEVEEAVGV
jgi:hypothetical protein